jgi:hypothetical protein
MVNYVTLAFGVFLLGVGIVDLSFYLTGKQDKFRKYNPMKKFWGKTFGPILHFTAYVIVPLVVGLMFLWDGFAGKGLF